MKERLVTTVSDNLAIRATCASSTTCRDLSALCILSRALKRITLPFGCYDTTSTFF